MDRRGFLTFSVGLGLSITLTGCRGRQIAHVLEGQDDMVGSHTAGAETWKPLVHQAVGQLLGRHTPEIQTTSAEVPAVNSGYGRRICFIGVENHSAEELGDFREQLYEQIDSTISQSGTYSSVSRRLIEAGLRQTRLHPQDLFIPSNRSVFAQSLEQIDAPVDYLLFAKLTSGTTTNNDDDYQRDYTLTLDLVDLRTGAYDKESATIRKGYHRSRLGKLRNYGRNS